ncbi:hypothetical protein GQ42DRAFT_31434 [Ramicandelaber brevisporus]|nr:hypothetical protein GQ42DRAFT_31434 [Ramicandelaber brevisporus]
MLLVEARVKLEDILYSLPTNSFYFQTKISDMNKRGDECGAAVASWRAIALPALQTTLDAQSATVLQQQQDSLAARKRLAESTRELRKSLAAAQVSTDVSDSIKSLLKEYQAEIDGLTKRLKSTESAFLGAYTAIGEAPDPVPLLETLIAERDGSIRREQDAGRELASVRDKSTQLTAEHEAQVSQLRAQVRQANEQLESIVQDRTAARETEIHASYSELISQLRSREADLSSQLATAQAQLDQAAPANAADAPAVDSAAEIARKAREAELALARQREMDDLVNQLERARERNAQLGIRNEELRRQLNDSNAANSNSAATITREEHTRQLSAVNNECDSAIQAKRDAETALDASKQEAERFRDDVARLEQQLAKRADYDDIRRELQVIKAVEFSLAGQWDINDDEEATADTGSAEGEDTKASVRDSLETLLMKKNKALQSDLVVSRNRMTELESHSKKLESDLESKQNALQTAEALVKKLEHDLMRVGSSSANNNADSASPANSTTPIAQTADQQTSSPTIDSAPATPGGARKRPEAAIMQIITAQRDRFRQRVSELEDDLQKSGEISDGLQREIDGLKQDNMSLYERIRYMQSYLDINFEAQSPGVQAMTVTSTSTSIPMDNTLPAPSSMGSRASSKYHEMYEERMNPFNEFARRESTRRYQSLNAADRAVLNAGRMIVMSRMGRLVAVGYILGLHCFVLLMTYNMALKSDRR